MGHSHSGFRRAQRSRAADRAEHVRGEAPAIRTTDFQNVGDGENGRFAKID